MTKRTKAARKPRGRPRTKAQAGQKRTTRVDMRKRRRLSQAPARPGSLDVEDVKVELFARGRIYKRYISCGKEDCRCTSGGRAHGPYHYLVLPVPKHLRKRGGPRTRWFYLTADEAKEWRERIANYKRLQEMVWENVLDSLE